MISTRTSTRDSTNRLGVQNLVNEVLYETSSSLDAMLRGEHSFFFGNRSICAQPVDIIRWLSELYPSSGTALHIRNTILSAASDAEQRCPGGGIISMLVAKTVLRRASGLREVEERSQTVLDSIGKVMSRSRRCSSLGAFKLMSEMDGCLESLEVARRSILECSANASILVLPSESEESSTIETVHGYRFPSHLPDVFLSSSRFASQRHLETPRVIVIDGMVDRMSEIEDVIGGSYQSRTPLVIFSRGYSGDVQNTLGTNYSSGHLIAFPLCVPYDELGANMLSDISVVCGANPISSLKGELISSRTWKELRSVDKITVSPNSSLILNRETVGSVKRQRHHLRKKRTECAQLEVPVIDKRLQCLMGEGVVLRLGGELGDLGGIVRDRVNSHIRSFRAVAKMGVIDVSLLDDSPTLLELRQSLQNRFTFIPAIGLLSGVRAGLSCARSLSSLGGVVKLG